MSVQGYRCVARYRPIVALGFLVSASAGGSTISVDLSDEDIYPAAAVRMPDVGSGPRPLIVLLHGYSSSASEVEGFLYQLGGRAEAAGFLLAMVDGSSDSLGNRFWNATDACCDFFGTNPDDVGYLLALIDEIDEQLGGVDRERIYFAGHSNGGFMSYRMACEHADKIAAVVSFAGATYKDEAACTPSRPVPVLQIHGTADDRVPYAGGTLPPPAPPVVLPGAIETVETWAAYDGCDTGDFHTSAPFDGVNGGSTTDTSIRRYELGCSGAFAELWTIQDGSHFPFPNTVSEVLRDRVFSWLLAAGSQLQRDGFETGDGTLWDGSDPEIPAAPP